MPRMRLLEFSFHPNSVHLQTRSVIIIIRFARNEIEHYNTRQLSKLNR